MYQRLLCPHQFLFLFPLGFTPSLPWRVGKYNWVLASGRRAEVTYATFKSGPRRPPGTSSVICSHLWVECRDGRSPRHSKAAPCKEHGSVNDCWERALRLSSSSHHWTMLWVINTPLVISHWDVGIDYYSTMSISTGDRILITYPWMQAKEILPEIIFSTLLRKCPKDISMSSGNMIYSFLWQFTRP